MRAITIFCFYFVCSAASADCGQLLTWGVYENFVFSGAFDRETRLVDQLCNSSHSESSRSIGLNIPDLPGFNVDKGSASNEEICGHTESDSSSSDRIEQAVSSVSDTLIRGYNECISLGGGEGAKAIVHRYGDRLGFGLELQVDYRLSDMRVEDIEIDIEGASCRGIPNSFDLENQNTRTFTCTRSSVEMRTAIAINANQAFSPSFIGIPSIDPIETSFLELMPIDLYTNGTPATAGQRFVITEIELFDVFDEKIPSHFISANFIDCAPPACTGEAHWLVDGQGIKVDQIGEKYWTGLDTQTMPAVRLSFPTTKLGAIRIRQYWEAFCWSGKCAEGVVEQTQGNLKTVEIRHEEGRKTVIFPNLNRDWIGHRLADVE